MQVESEDESEVSEADSENAASGNGNAATASRRPTSAVQLGPLAAQLPVSFPAEAPATTPSAGRSSEDQSDAANAPEPRELHEAAELSSARSQAGSTGAAAEDGVQRNESTDIPAQQNPGRGFESQHLAGRRLYYLLRCWIRNDTLNPFMRSQLQCSPSLMGRQS